jgi:RHS repeat-associated protein
MTTQKPISKSPISDAFLSKNAEGNYLSNGCFCARCKNITSFTFTGKEKDTETGFSYFGARYLEHELTTAWLSVDPLADKYPSISPYAYCAWNPVKLVDPEGESCSPVYDTLGNFIGCTKEGFTGDILIYLGKYQNDFSNITQEEAENIRGVVKYDNIRKELSNDCKAKIWTSIAEHFNGERIYDLLFDISSIDGGQISYFEKEGVNWETSRYYGTIKGTDSYSYESTVENLASSIIVHEWYSHFKKGNGDRMKSHRLAYKNVINFKRFWDMTTDKYKNFVLLGLLKYTTDETGRTIVDKPYRGLYNKHVNKMMIPLLFILICLPGFAFCQENQRIIICDDSKSNQVAKNDNQRSDNLLIDGDSITITVPLPLSRDYFFVAHGSFTMKYKDGGWTASLPSGTLEYQNFQKKIECHAFEISINDLIDSTYFTEYIFDLFVTKKEPIAISKKARPSVYSDYFSFRFKYSNKKQIVYSFGEEDYDINYSSKYIYVVDKIIEIRKCVINKLIEVYKD